MEYNYRELFKGLAQYRSPLNYELTGQTLDIRLEGAAACRLEMKSDEVLYLDFGDIHQENKYEAFKIDDHVYFLHFEIENQSPRLCFSLVYEKEKMEATIFLARQGHCKEYLRKVDRDIYFGSVRRPDGTYPSGHAEYTEELVGKAIDFTYTSKATVRHTYCGPHEFMWEFIAAGANAKGAGQKEYCDYVKINDHIFIFSWLEKIAGVQGLCVENLDRLYHVGGFFGIGPDDLPECYSMAAYGRPAPFISDSRKTQE